MLDLLKRDDLISMKHLNELIKGLNKKDEIEERKVNTWLIVGLVTLGLLVAGLIVYKVFFAGDEYDEFDEFDDEFDDMDYDDDYDDFDDFEEEADEVEEIEEDFEENEEE
jgi:hypothetical protein